MELHDIQSILNECEFNDWHFVAGEKAGEIFLQIRCEGVCNVTGEAMPWSSRKWFVSKHSCKSEVVLTLFKAVMTAMEHETREQFTYKGRTIFGPHFDVDKLASLCDDPTALDERPVA